MKNQISEVIKEEVDESVHSDRRSQAEQDNRGSSSGTGVTRKTRTDEIEPVIEEERKRQPDDFYENDFEEPMPVTIEDRSTPEAAAEIKELE